MQYQVASDKIISKRIGEEIIVINLDNGMYYSLLDSGMPIWDCLNAGASAAEVSELFLNTFPDQNSAADDINNFISELVEEGLIVGTNVSDYQVPGIDWAQSYAAPRLEKHEDISELVALDPPLPEMH
ncbi:MAG: PqqD family protein [Paracoccaceae bacterium]|jgi:hypothetical protein